MLGDLDYPIDREAAAAALDDVTLVLADGTADLGELVSETPSDAFDSPADLEAALHNVLPRRAVGEPFQSEGEG